MGVVYAADDDTLGRRVAVKVMMADLEDEPELRERFYREAKITGQLAHRNIVTVFDLGEDDGHPFIVMELLERVAARRSICAGSAETSRLDVKIDLMMQVCEGLQEAHRSGVIHRDIKPSNLFVQRDGELKILDFGVARLASSNLTAAASSSARRSTCRRSRRAASAVDARSDVFSAASVFYFMLTGPVPFGSHDLPRMLDAILHDDPPPLTEDAGAGAAAARR